MHAFAGGSGRTQSTTRFVGSLIASLLLAAVAFSAFPAGVHAASGRYLDPIFSSVRRDVDLTYGRAIHADGTIEALKLDLYRPVGDTAKNRPVVIFVHGGAQDTTDKNPLRNQLVGHLFAKRGFVGAVIDYRSGASGMDRAAAHDLRAAVRWFRKNADALRVSPKRIIVMGVSAGGTTAMSATFNPADVGNSGNPGYSSAVAAGIAFAAASYPHAEMNTGDPPIAVIVAKDDHPFYEEAIAACAQTRALGNICDEYYHESGGHPPEFWWENRDKIIEQSSRFICKRVLGPVVCRDRNGDGRVD